MGLTKAQLSFVNADYARKFAKSHVKDQTGSFPKFEKSELGLGKFLGKGGFGTVMEIRSFEIADMDKKKKVRDDDEADGMENKKFIAEHCIRIGGDSKGDARYAVKYLSPEVVNDPGRYVQGVMDLAIEVRFLSDIEHPHIVKLRALSTVDAYHEGFFIVMDRLYDTLEKRLEKWKKRLKGTVGLAGKLGDRKGTKAQDLMIERLVAAYDASAAFAHLHSRKIVYRDIKPENLGFDVRGDIKVFDFGLSKEINEDLSLGDGTYKLTGCTGSIRYMAPEVFLEKPYNLTCDAYSFALLLWQMLALERPFHGYLIKDIRARVHNGESRPKVDESWPQLTKLLLKKCWDNDWKERYNFPLIEETLRKELVKARQGDDSGLDHKRRRSTFVFKPTNKQSSRSFFHGAA